MKFLTFVDLHDDKKFLRKLIERAEQKDIEFVVCAGDISQFSRGIKEVLNQFNALGKKLYLIPGNHESCALLESVKEEFSYCVNLHQSMVKIGDYIFLGYGEGGFSLEDQEFRKISRKWYDHYRDEKIVLVTHAPPFGTEIDRLEQRHVGNQDIRKFIERLKPKLAICGHIHETAGKIDQVGKTKIINPGWKGMVIELG